MSEGQKKRGMAFWPTVVLRAALVGYPLRFGPAVWLVAHDRLPPRATSIVFRPLLTEARREFVSDLPVGRPLLWWASVWDSPANSMLGMRGLGMLLSELQ
jgi:hypothetical protein